ncbi:DoxX family membrane protein [Actinokineospora enzanensis]|uniref:DoxX family membrane protein n=1 Tax=Actinokineospora enzanensis TaxID=155975 RepID=UPI0009FDB291|nr:DoxX family membrane protein [Actinokineospora enzanensis]
MTTRSLSTTPVPTAPPVPRAGQPAPARGACSLAVARLVMAGVFLWAFLDKTFGLGYSTPSGKGWIDGGSPTRGFLGALDHGPFTATLRSWAGNPFADWLFMVGLLGIGLALLLGIGLRVAAVGGVLMLAMMWIAEWPPARHTDHGALTRSTNPLLDYHVVYAVLLVVLAATAAGDRWGLGRWWASLDLVRRAPWLR